MRKLGSAVERMVEISARKTSSLISFEPIRLASWRCVNPPSRGLNVCSCASGDTQRSGGSHSLRRVRPLYALLGAQAEGGGKQGLETHTDKEQVKDTYDRFESSSDKAAGVNYDEITREKTVRKLRKDCVKRTDATPPDYSQ